MTVAELAGRSLHSLQPVVDVSLSKQRNAAVTAEQFERLSPGGWPPKRTLDELRREVAPYLTDGKAGLGLVVFVDRMNKKEGLVFGHFVLFRQDGGEILLYGQEKGGLARGSLNRVYRLALERIATRAARAVSRNAVGG